MKTFFTKTLIIIIYLVSINKSIAQVTVASTCGYTITTCIKPIQVIPIASYLPNNCPWGYNYDVKFNYQITVAGINSCAFGPTTIEIQPNIVCGVGNNNYYSKIIVPAPTFGAASTTVVYTGTAKTTTGQWTSSTNCATVTMATLPCNTSTPTISFVGSAIAGIPNGVEFAGALCATLPIELLSFDGQCIDNVTNLNWSTASEINNDFFTVEQSTNLDQWNIITQQKGAGNSTSTNNYHYKHTNDASTIDANVYYYRLKQTDYDGGFTYSDIISINNCNKTMSKNNVIYNNPVIDGKLKISLVNATTAHTICIYNALGQCVYKNNGIENLIDVSNFQSGMYILNVYSNGESISSKLIITTPN